MTVPPLASETMPPLLPAPKDPQRLAVPAGYCLRRFVERSPAPVLPPLVFDAERRALQAVVYRSARAVTADAAPAVEVLICQAAAGQPLLIYGLPESRGAVGKRALATDWPDLQDLKDQVDTLLGLNEDLSLFYAMTQIDDELRWVGEYEAGRCLRAPQVFEDLLKGLLRARVAASKLPALCARLCALWGPPTSLQRRGFPTAATLAGLSLAQLAKKLQIAPALAKSVHALARVCSDGCFFPESLRRLPRDFASLLSEAQDDRDAEARVLTAVDAELEWQLRVAGLLDHLPGFGERACGFLHPLLGCHSEPQLDMTSLRTWQTRMHRRKTPSTVALKVRSQAADGVAQRILRRVGHYAIYAGLAQRLLMLGQPSV